MGLRTKEHDFFRQFWWQFFFDGIFREKWGSEPKNPIFSDNFGGRFFLTRFLEKNGAPNQKTLEKQCNFGVFFFLTLFLEKKGPPNQKTLEKQCNFGGIFFCSFRGTPLPALKNRQNPYSRADWGTSLIESVTAATRC